MKKGTQNYLTAHFCTKIQILQENKISISCVPKTLNKTKTKKQSLTDKW